MNRRDVLRVAAIPAIVAVSGCSEYVHRARGVDTPVSLIVVNTIDEPVRVTVRVERDGTTVFDGTTEFDDDGTVERIEGDDFRAAEFSEAGTYTLAVEANGAQEQSSTDVSWRYLTDCNYNTLEVLVREDGIDAGLIRTDAGCSFPDTLGKERRQ